MPAGCRGRLLLAQVSWPGTIRTAIYFSAEERSYAVANPGLVRPGPCPRSSVVLPIRRSELRCRSAGIGSSVRALSYVLPRRAVRVSRCSVGVIWPYRWIYLTQSAGNRSMNIREEPDEGWLGSGAACQTDQHGKRGGRFSKLSNRLA
jgi:hypothetical protein